MSHEHDVSSRDTLARKKKLILKIWTIQIQIKYILESIKL